MNSTLQYTLYALRMSRKERERRRRSAKYYEKHELNNPGEYGSANAFHYYKCIFIHIPKTGGLSISKTLFGNYGSPHLEYDWFLKNFGAKTVKAYYKFSFVRNPWDRLLSAYSFLKKGGMNKEDAAFAEKNLTHIKSFEEFVMDWLNEETCTAYWHFIPQYNFVTSEKNRDKIIVDFLGRFENLENDFNTVSKMLGFKNKSLLEININNKEKNRYKNSYSKEMKEKAGKIYGKDAEMFMYNF